MLQIKVVDYLLPYRLQLFLNYPRTTSYGIRYEVDVKFLNVEHFIYSFLPFRQKKVIGQTVNIFANRIAEEFINGL